MKKKLFIITLLFLTACNQLVFGQVPIEGIAGKYKYIHNKYDSAFLELRQDSTFIYYWAWKGLKGITKGKWKTDKKYLYLDSDVKPVVTSHKTEDLYSIKAITDTLLNGISIKLKDVNGLPVPSARCWVIASGNMYISYSDSSGFVYFNLKSLKHISVYVPFAQEGFITHKDKYVNNKFEISLLKVNQQYLYLSNEKLLLNEREGELFLHETFIDKKATNIFKKL